MRSVYRVLIFCLACCLQYHATARDADKLPRFATLKFEEVNVRKGAGKIFDIKWTFKSKGCKGYPVMIISEFEQWREIVDLEGEKGWIHMNELSNTKTVIVTKDTILRRASDERSVPIANIVKGAACKLKKARGEWCDIQCGAFRGWIRQEVLWGVT